MAIRLILVRHGITPWNYEFRYQGHTDIELHPEGIKQAYALQKKLAGEQLTAVYSSDLKRAVQTANIIAEPHNLETKIVPELKEINFGVWEGLTYYDIEKQYPQLLKVWLETPHLLKIPEGESFEILRDRAVTGIKKILASQQKGTLAVVTHGGTIAALVCGLLKEPLANMWQYKQKNTAVTVLAIKDGKVTLESLNDVSHLSATS